MQRSLREKAIKIKGKDYVLVSDRVVYFNEHFPSGSIQTELISDPSSKYIIVRARVVPDATKPDRVYTGYSQAVIGQGFINEVSALENAETSAVGRALAFMGIGVLDSIASANEIRKAESSRPGAPVSRQPPFPSYRSNVRQHPPQAEHATNDHPTKFREDRGPGRDDAPVDNDNSF